MWGLIGIYFNTIWLIAILGLKNIINNFLITNQEIVNNILFLFIYTL